MFCPSCGASIDSPNQRYCQECGTTLPAAGGQAIAHRPSGGVAPIEPRRSARGALALLPGNSTANKLLAGAGLAVVGVIVLYVILGAIVGFLISLVPLLILAAAAYGGFLYCGAAASMDTDEERIVTARAKDEDAAELSLRPKRLAEYIGQDKVKANLHILLDAAKGRREPLDHILLYGPPGLGKTTLATIVASEMGSNIRITSGPAFERPGDVVSILTNLSEGDVLFVDEIHRLNRVIEETLYPAMEDFAVDFILGKGPSARTMRMALKRFTLVGATTRLGLISAPLRDRFGVHYNLEFYSQEALEEIVRRSALVLKMRIDDGGVAEVARRSRGTPRVANRLLKRVRDYAQMKADGLTTQAVAQEALAMLEVDPLGLDATDIRLLDTIIRKFGGGPVGLDTIAAATHEERDTVEDVYEPFLLQLGFLQRTPRGRVATALAYAHLGLTPPQRPDQPLQQALFGSTP